MPPERHGVPTVPVADPRGRADGAADRASVPVTRHHLLHVLQALLVTFLWSTSWVLIKIGLVDIPALTFAGMRYALATLVLLPFVLRGDRLAALRRLSGRAWGDLLLLGVVLYALTQGAQFLALAFLPAATLSLVLSFSPLVVAWLAGRALQESLAPRQWFGIALVAVGALTYFGPTLPPLDQRVGLLIALVGLAANAAGGVLGRAVNRTRALDPLLVTVGSMGVGAAVLLATGLAMQGPPSLSATSVAIVVWLAVVNTAFAFTLWNLTLRHLTAVESSVINNTMLIQIAVLAWLFLGETLTAIQIAGIALVTVGTLIVQWRRGHGDRTGARRWNPTASRRGPRRSRSRIARPGPGTSTFGRR
jgi:drug/metabolite transporter (DMT)-like permease